MHALPGSGVSRSESRHDVGQRRTRAIFRRLRGAADMHEAGDLLVGGEAERVEHAAVIGVPFGDPVRRKAERMRGGHQVHRGGAGGEHLLPFGDLHMRRGAAHHRDDERRARQAIALEGDLIRGSPRDIGA